MWHNGSGLVAGRGGWDAVGAPWGYLDGEAIRAAHDSVKRFLSENDAGFDQVAGRK